MQTTCQHCLRVAHIKGDYKKMGIKLGWFTS